MQFRNGRAILEKTFFNGSRRDVKYLKCSSSLKLYLKLSSACFILSIFDGLLYVLQAIQKLASVRLAEALRDKQMLFVKWKLAEAKVQCSTVKSRIFS
jgi:hypothetical protein